MSEVVSLRAVEPTKPEPVAEVVEALKALLTMAERGEIVAVGYAMVRRDDSFQTWWSGANNTNFSLCTGIARLNWRYQAEAFSEVGTSNNHDPSR